MVEHAPDCGSVYGVPRGGLFLAVALSHHLNVPLVQRPIYDSLIVDDVVETGRTLNNHMQFERPFMVWVNKSQLVVPSVLEFPADTWIVFPWEDAARATRDAEAYYASRQ